MPNPYLLFCPYLPPTPNNEIVEFADWELGPFRCFEDRWADPDFKSLATTFLGKFTRPSDNKPIENPALLCKKGEQLDGRKPSNAEMRALELSLAFGFLDSNPRQESEDHEIGWGMVTTDNLELHLWSIELEQGRLTLERGYLVEATISGFRIDDPQFIVTAPLDLHLPSLPPSPDPLVLTGIYETILTSLCSPDAEPEAHRVHFAVDWLAKAWRNTASVHYPERIVFLKTAFEAVTRTSKAYKSASRLRRMFESLPDTTDFDSDILVWSPEEKPRHNYTWKDTNDLSKRKLITDLEAWFLAFSKARNTIIHEGIIPDLVHPSSASKQITSRTIYHCHFFYTAERLLRGVIKVLLCKLGYKDAWRTQLSRVLEPL